MNQRVRGVLTFGGLIVLAYRAFSCALYRSAEYAPPPSVTYTSFDVTPTPAVVGVQTTITADFEMEDRSPIPDGYECRAAFGDGACNDPKCKLGMVSECCLGERRGSSCVFTHTFSQPGTYEPFVAFQRFDRITAWATPCCRRTVSAA